MKIPYQLIAAVDTYTRHTQVLEALKHGFPRLKQMAFDESRVMHVACYGPSLLDTWQELEGKRPIMSMSGATRFLAEKGIVADYHCDMDPRPYKSKFIDPPIPGVHYLMASICHPSTWDILKGEQVTIWHTVSCHSCTEAFIAKYDHGELVINPGSTIGLGALHLGGVLGYRHFEIHGMDSSFKGPARHAGEHFGKVQADNFTWDAGGVTYRTSKIMANGAAEAVNQVSHMPIFTVFYGDGLIQALIEEANVPNACRASNTEKAAKIRRSRAHVLPLGGDVNEPKSFTDPFDALLRYPPDAWVEELKRLSEFAESRRALAKFNTGTLSYDSMLFLRALTEVIRPQIVAEVGTFIGSSTLAIQAGLREGGHIYTCDKDNDCLPPDEGRTCHPGQTSTAMFVNLVDKGLKVDLFFFDGRIQLPDLPLILRLSHPKTIYAFDDYTDNEKGTVNVERLRQFLPKHGLVSPQWKPGVTLALLVPLLQP